ncbi:MAG: hypothetical protein GC136_03705 [Alphaproteobacteria bacterium]|nr:hypothetical protein [Alphaproteobacteria bacterium]
MITELIKEPLRLRNMWSHATDSAIVLDSAVSVIGMVKTKKGRTGHGTGVLIAPRVVVTAYHVDDALYKRAIIKHGIDEVISIEDTMRFPDIDVSVIYLEKPLPGPYAQICDRNARVDESVIYPNVRLRRRRPYEETIAQAKEKRRPDFFNRGRAKGSDWEHWKGWRGRDVIKFTALSRGGNSGSAIFERSTNKIVSIVSTGGRTLIPHFRESSYGPRTEDLREAVDQALEIFEQRYGAEALALTK